MKRFVIRSALVLFVIILLPIAYIGITLFRASGGLPQWEGELLDLNLNAKVEVVRDSNGIPFIRAESERDLYFTQGFVHAQDRFWQMALTRQAMLGRLAEWMGAPAINGDRIARMWDWQPLARQSLEALPSNDRDLLEAYAEGVNAWLDNPEYRRPAEMVILHIEPERWRAEHTNLFVYSMNRVLASAGSEQGRARFGAEAYDILDETILPVPPIIPTAKPSEILQPTAAYKSRSFSDNWTLSGEYTISGKPLMANDPQLAVSLPGTWHLQHHSLPAVEWRAGRFPACPASSLGTMAGSPGALQMLWWTPLGVIWPVGLDSTIIGERDNLTLEIRDVAADSLGQAAVGFVRLNRASNVTEGIAALRGHNAPAVNISLADDAGNIGYAMAGRIPLRPKAHATQIGQAPEDGNEWRLLPFEENPRMLNPTGGRIVTANQRIAGDEYPHYVTDRWAAPYRARRIHELLDTHEQHDVDSFIAMQMDPVSTVARELTPLMLVVDPATDADGELVGVLRHWDYRFSLDSAAPMIWMTWVDALRKRMLEDELDSFSLERSVVLYSPLMRALSGERAKWCDDVSTAATEDCDALLQASLMDARQRLTEAFGPNVSDWQWGEGARFHIPHLGFARLPVLDRMFSRNTAIPGGPESLFMNGVVTTGSPRFSTTTWSSSYQGVYDLSDLDSSQFMMTGGSSGLFRSPFYNNLTE